MKHAPIENATPFIGARLFSILRRLPRPVDYEQDAAAALQHSLRSRPGIRVALAVTRHGLSLRQSDQPAADHRLHQVAGSRRRRPHRGRHGLDQDAQRQPSRRHRAGPGPLLGLPVQVRRRLPEPTACRFCASRATRFWPLRGFTASGFTISTRASSASSSSSSSRSARSSSCTLSLKFRHRHTQLQHLHDLVMASRKPVIVAGDFNTFWGEHEIYLFMKACRLRSANTRQPAVVSEPVAAQGARFRVVRRRRARDELRDPVRAAVGSSAARLRFRDRAAKRQAAA